MVSEYNGRQGLSWIAGWGLECVDCKFNNTGRAINQGGGWDDGQPLVSKPGAGVDIEPDPGVFTREGVFTRCEFANNAGAGMLCDRGDGGYSTFDDCTFWGTTYFSIWARLPGLKFVNSRIHGTAVHASDGHSASDPAPDPSLATIYEGCTFEDLPWVDGTVHRTGYLYNVSNGGAGATWRNCTFITHEERALWISDTGATKHFERCTFRFGDTSLASGTFHVSFQGSELRSCRFEETAAISSATRTYYINVAGTVVAAPLAGDPPTHVAGPRVRWNATNGPVGDIAPGTY